MLINLLPLGLGFFFILFVYYSPFILRKFEENQLKRYCSENGILVLSYDDGPGPRLTRKLLEVFSDADIFVTFFFVGWKATKHPDIIRKAKEAGHEVGFHGQNHLNAWKVAPWTAIHDISLGYKALECEMSNYPIYRPPFGKITIVTWLMLRIHSIRVGWWTHVSGDTEETIRPTNGIISEIIANNGGVILMHDADRPNRTEEYEDFVIAITLKLINIAKQKKWRIKTLGTLINDID